jgi:hypothetical protein
MKIPKCPSARHSYYWKAYLIRSTVIAISAICVTNSVFAQVDNSYITDIKGYVHEIDSLIHAEPAFIVQAIAEGPIQLLITVDSLGHVDSTKYSGGFSIYTNANRKGDTLYRINYNDNLFMYRVENYYYRSNQLVCATLLLQDWENGKKEVYRKEVYYQNKNGNIQQEDKIISNLLEDKYLWRVNFSLLDKGLEYLRHFLNKKSLKF